MKLLLLFFLIRIPVTHSFAQIPPSENILLKGTIADKENNKPLAFASVGILDKPQGTVSDTSGHFSFPADQTNLPDTLQISMVGYYTRRIAIKDFWPSANKLILMERKADQLAAITVTSLSVKTHTEIIGRQSASKLVQVSVHNKKTADETIGSEMGMLYQTHQKDAILKDFSFYVSANNFNFIKFRINVYSVKANMPDTLLCNKQIFETLDAFRTGWIKVDLEHYRIKVNGEFIVTLQWIESRMDKKENPITILPVAATLFSRNCYVRIASQDKWKRMGINLSSFVSVLY